MMIKESKFHLLRQREQMLCVVNFAKSLWDKGVHLHGCLTISNLIYVVQVETLEKFCFLLSNTD